MQDNCAVVWLKKDLRASDHRPLWEATRRHRRVIALYIYEPEWLQSYEFHSSHLVFLNQSLSELAKDLANIKIQLVLRWGTATEVFHQLRNEFPYQAVYAHQETGILWTFERDLKLLIQFKENNIQFKEYYQFAVVRRLQNRNLWNDYRRRIIERKLIPDPVPKNELESLPSVGVLNERDLNLPQNSKTEIQHGGARQAWQTLHSFLTHRCENYIQNMSSPQYAGHSCSRLSPYISFGNISLTQIHHQMRQNDEKLFFSDDRNKNFRKNIWAFENRLWWHCHFIQKLESEFQIEFRNVNSGFDEMRENDFNPSYFEAWKKGETGFPMVDAVMRCLLQTGWINFRMRAMLASFSAYQLWLHWEKPAQFLAPHFLDFEPGIHFSQFQMQSGVTGINTIRIYSPTKQAAEQKGAADFIRKYVPELALIPDEYIHDPQSMPPLFQIEMGFKMGTHYPYPIVDPKKSYDDAKQKIFNYRQRSDVKQQARQVLVRHASRSHGKKGKADHFPQQEREAIFGNLKKDQG